MFLTDENNAIVRFINDKLDNFAVIDKLVTIREIAFKDEKVLQKIELQDVVTIKESAFEDCENLVVLIAVREEAKNSNLIIQHNAFKNCYELRDIVLLGYDKITIEAGAFSGCNKLRNLVIDKADLDIRTDVFSDTDKEKFRIFYKSADNIQENLQRFCRENDITCKKYSDIKKLQQGQSDV